VVAVAAIVGGGLASAVIGAGGARGAAKTQAAAGQAAIDEQRRQFDIILGLTQPGRAVGNQALNTLGQAFIPGFTGFGGGGGTVPGNPLSEAFRTGTFPTDTFAGGTRIDPETGQPVPETGQPVDANALSDIFRNLPGTQFLVDQSRRGVEASGAARGDPFGGNVLREIGTQTASLAENQVINRLLQLAGFGPQATGQAVAGAGAAGANISQLLTGIGGAQAAGTLGQAGSINNAIQGTLNNLLLQQFLSGGIGGFGGGGFGGGFGGGGGGGGFSL